MKKRERTRLARAEMWLQLSMSAQRWADEVTDNSPDSKPVAEWSPDEPLLVIMRTHDLSQADLGRLLTTMAQQLENKAIASGYGEYPDPVR